MDDLEQKSFEIISSVGYAKSCFMKAIQLAYEEKYSEAQKAIDEGNEYFTQGHIVHASMLQQEASGNHIMMTLLLTHAEDQLMSTELCKTMANEIIRLYKKVGNK